MSKFIKIVMAVGANEFGETHILKESIDKVVEVDRSGFHKDSNSKVLRSERVNAIVRYADEQVGVEQTIDEIKERLGDAGRNFIELSDFDPDGHSIRVLAPKSRIVSVSPISNDFIAAMRRQEDLSDFFEKNVQSIVVYSNGSRDITLQDADTILMVLES